MDATYITPLIESVKNVFSTMLQWEVEFQTPSLKAVDSATHDVSGIIGLSGDVTGAVVLAFPLATAKSAVSTFVGMEMDEKHEDFADAIGELVNMVTGNAKAKFQSKQVSISCPSVVIGAGHQVFQQKDAAIIEIPCDCACGSFSVNISIKETNAADNPVQAASA